LCSLYGEPLMITYMCDLHHFKVNKDDLFCRALVAIQT
jgi:hypothetical protein